MTVYRIIRQLTRPIVALLQFFLKEPLLFINQPEEAVQI